MAIRQRAIQAVDKQERHQAILDAAERLLLRAPDRIPNVADVADEAGLAKGTVYLYFPSKEELLLALHERNIDGFFLTLDAVLDAQRERVTLEDLLAITFERIVRRPLLLPLAARCFALMAQSIPAEVAETYRVRMAERLEHAGKGLERLFPALAPGEGVAKLRHSFALIIGLWQMSAASGCGARTDLTVVKRGDAVPAAFVWSFPDELRRALNGMWQSVTAESKAPARR
jgi:AcrR family transcriptional regulator